MPERFGNYELLEKIAVGGMAEIFKARAVHGQGVEKTIVLKRIHPALSTDKNFVAMFIDEARLGVSMVHGNIVPVFDFGCVDGYYYLAMEHVAGWDLAALSARARIVGLTWPVELACHIVAEVLEGLAYAHQKRDSAGRPLEIVHRDVSPSNILLSEDGQVKLLDFGIARTQAREHETRTGVIKGKPGYMSPEQASGRTVDARADIWSCGAVLYELMAGRRLQEGRRAIGDPELERILDRALAADPSERMGGARELQSAVADLLVARGLRAGASELAAFIQRVVSAPAPGEDWDMASVHVERHLAAALTHRADTGSSGGAPQVTKRLAKGRRSLRWPAIAGLVAVLVLGAALAGALLLGRQEESAGPARTRPVGRTAAKATLALVSRPKGAAIAVDGVRGAAKTPAVLELEPGEHRVELALSGFEPWSETVRLAAGKEMRLETSLTQVPPTLEITVEPAGARVAVDGIDRGQAPVTLADLVPGRHRLSAAAPGRVPANQEVDLPAGETVRIALSLKEKTPSRSKPNVAPAVLSINSDPWSRVTLNGEPIGDTPILGRSVEPGKYRIVLTNPVRNVSKVVEVSLEPGEKRRIREVLPASE